jgi:dTDP-4-dehydrorhamnose reductase
MAFKILVTGAFGQLGTDCNKILSEKNHVTVCSHEQMDITIPENVNVALMNLKPDIIINCAAYTRVDDCETKIDFAYKVNSEGPEILARYANQIGATLVHISTDYVFDGNLEVPQGYVETDSPNPVSVYGKSKYEGEKAIVSETDHYVIIRTSWLFGISGKNFLKTIYHKAVSDHTKALKIINTQYGSFTHTIHLARQIQTLIDSKATGIYHASGEGYCTWYEGARYFFNAMSIHNDLIPCTEKEFPTKAVRPQNSILDNRRLKDEHMNEIPQWQENIDSFVRIFKKEI